MPVKLLITLSLLLMGQFSQAQNFSISNIPEKVLKKADAVVRFEDISVEIVSQEKMRVHIKKAITVFNKKSDYLAEIQINYNKYNHINNVVVEYFNAYGKSVKKVRKKDFSDFSATDNSSLYTDERLIAYNYIPIEYPYTVYYEYSLTSKSTAFIPSWTPISSSDLGLVKSKYTLKYPPFIQINKAENNFSNYPIKKKQSPGFLSYSLDTIAPIKEEFLSVNYLKRIPKLRVSSTQFSLRGIKGSATTWEEYGKWVYNHLLNTRNNLSTATKQKIKTLVRGVEDPLERAKIIYDYVQNKTRYISIQIGIGGWQPMFTDDVDKLGYGDCKALTFYTKSLMDVAEVPSYYSLVYAGDTKRDIQKNTVSMQGNHAILCLPQEKDTIWLECTSQKVPFGYKNSFTDDRDVLVITPQGGKIIHTNTNKATENLQETIASYTLKDNGEIAGSVKIESYGTQYHSHLAFDGLSPSKLDERMKDYFDKINNLSFSKIEVNNNKSKMCYQESIDFSAAHYAIINPDSSILLTLNAFNRNEHIPKREKNRKTDFEISRGYKDVDKYTIELPKGYKFPTTHKPINFENQFGTYTLTLEKISENKLLYKRTFILNKGLYDKNLYDDYRSFRKKIKRYENMKILLPKL